MFKDDVLKLPHIQNNLKGFTTWGDKRLAYKEFELARSWIKLSTGEELPTWGQILTQLGKRQDVN